LVLWLPNAEVKEVAGSWDFAQKYAGEKMIVCGLFLACSSLIGVFVDFGESTNVLVGLGLMLILYLIPVVLTERELKKRFG